MGREAYHSLRGSMSVKRNNAQGFVDPCSSQSGIFKLQSRCLIDTSEQMLYGGGSYPNILALACCCTSKEVRKGRIEMFTALSRSLRRPTAFLSTHPPFAMSTASIWRVKLDTFAGEVLMWPPLQGGKARSNQAPHLYDHLKMTPSPGPFADDVIALDNAESGEFLRYEEWNHRKNLAIQHTCPAMDLKVSALTSIYPLFYSISGRQVHCGFLLHES